MRSLPDIETLYIKLPKTFFFSFESVWFMKVRNNHIMYSIKIIKTKAKSFRKSIRSLSSGVVLAQLK